jgi:hypothetical protein
MLPVLCYPASDPFVCFCFCWLYILVPYLRSHLLIQCCMYFPLCFLLGFSFFFGSRVWTQGLLLARQVLLPLEPLHHPSSRNFKVWGLTSSSICVSFVDAIIFCMWISNFPDTFCWRNYCFHHTVFVVFLFLGGWYWSWTQGLVLGRWALYHLSYYSSPFCSGYFGFRVSLFA